MTVENDHSTAAIPALLRRHEGHLFLKTSVGVCRSWRRYSNLCHILQYRDGKKTVVVASGVGQVEGA